MALKVINIEKIGSCFNRFVDFIIEPSVWYPNLNKRIKSKLQMLQSKCIRLCLDLNDSAHRRKCI